MTKYVFRKMPMTLHDFGECFLTEWETELFDHILGSMLPQGLDWCGDELLADVDDDSDELETFDLDEAINKAWETFCACDGREKLIEAAERYDVTLPDPGLPMYYEDSTDGNDIRDVKGEQIKRISDITGNQWVIVETDYDAATEDATRDDIHWFKLTQKPSTTFRKLRAEEVEYYGEPKTVSELIERGGVEDAEDEEVLVYEGTIASVTPEESCIVYIPTYWD